MRLDQLPSASVTSPRARSTPIGISHITTRHRSFLQQPEASREPKQPTSDLNSEQALQGVFELGDRAQDLDEHASCISA
jgi:hypothetical protein